MKTTQFIVRTFMFAVGTFGASAAFTGCTTVVDSVTPNANVYVRGELQANFDRRYDAVERAALRALNELQFSKIEEKKDALVANLEARNADDDKILVRVERTSETLTTVRIKVGRMPAVGNEKLSYTIYNKIKESL
jgi:hypothetical protein